MTLTGWRHRLFLIAPFAAVVGLLAVSPSDDGPTICPFALCTGTACPGCGMTRAAGHLVRGDISVAFGYHPLIPIIAVQALGGWTWYMLRRSGKVGPMKHRTINIILIGTAVALLAVWGLRMVTGSLPSV